MSFLQCMQKRFGLCLFFLRATAARHFGVAYFFPWLGITSAPHPHRHLVVFGNLFSSFFKALTLY